MHARAHDRAIAFAWGTSVLVLDGHAPSSAKKSWTWKYCCAGSKDGFACRVNIRDTQYVVICREVVDLSVCRRLSLPVRTPRTLCVPPRLPCLHLWERLERLLRASAMSSAPRAWPHPGLCMPWHAGRQSRALGHSGAVGILVLLQACDRWQALLQHQQP